MKGNGFTTRAERMIAVCGISLALFAAAGSSHAQSVFSAGGAYSMGRTHELDCSVVIGNSRFGFDQYRQSQDANGKNLYTTGDVLTKEVESPRYTTVFIGPLRFTVPGPMWIVGSILAAGIGGIIVFMVAGVGKARWVLHVHRTA
jgi:hypothetical protein